MTFNIGDYVTRNSHNNDMVFIITDINNNVCNLKGVNIRLYADSPLSDLKKTENVKNNDEDFVNIIRNVTKLDRDDYFYLPGKILHIDGDEGYLNRCLNYYEKINLVAMGLALKEDSISNNITVYLEKYKPNILVITGHDAYYKKRGEMDDINSYKNSLNFVNAVKEARKYEGSHEKLIIIAGACQSNYEELIKAGANFASSPKRVNIHALDPALIAARMSLSNINKDIDLKDILSNTKSGKEGIGGIITKGTMYVGYPR